MSRRDGSVRKREREIARLQRQARKRTRRRQRAAGEMAAPRSGTCVQDDAGHVALAD